MSVRVKRYGNNIGTPGDDDATEWTDDAPIEQRTGIDSEGYMYHFGLNETKNFLDDGRGLAVAATDPAPGVTEIDQDPIPFGSALS